MKRSISFRLVGWLEGISDHLSKVLVKLLRGSEVHADTGGDLCNGFVVGINDQATESKVDNTDMLPSLHDHLNEVDWSPIIPDFNILISEGHLPAAANHNIICHQKYHSAKNIFDFPGQIMKAPKLGVQS